MSHLYYYLRGFSCLGPSIFLLKKKKMLLHPYVFFFFLKDTSLCLNRDKTKKQSGKNITLTPTKTLSKK